MFFSGKTRRGGRTSIRKIRSADTGRDIIEDALIRLAYTEARLRVQDKLRAAREYMKAAGYGK